MGKTQNKSYRNAKNSSTTIKYNVEGLGDDETRGMYTVETENRFSALLLDWEANEKMPNELWKEMSDTYKEITKSKLGKVNHKNHS